MDSPTSRSSERETAHLDPLLKRGALHHLEKNGYTAENKAFGKHEVRKHGSKVVLRFSSSKR